MKKWCVFFEGKPKATRPLFASREIGCVCSLGWLEKLTATPPAAFLEGTRFGCVLLFFFLKTKRNGKSHFGGSCC